MKAAIGVKKSDTAVEVTIEIESDTAVGVKIESESYMSMNDD